MIWAIAVDNGCQHDADLPRYTPAPSPVHLPQRRIASTNVHTATRERHQRRLHYQLIVSCGPRYDIKSQNSNTANAANTTITTTATATHPNASHICSFLQRKSDRCIDDRQPYNRADNDQVEWSGRQHRHRHHCRHQPNEYIAGLQSLTG